MPLRLRKETQTLLRSRLTARCGLKAAYIQGPSKHSVATLIGQRVFGIALGYEDLNDHDGLRRRQFQVRINI